MKTSWSELERAIEQVVAKAAEALEAAAQIAVKYIGATDEDGGVMTENKVVAFITEHAPINRGKLLVRINELNGIVVPESVKTELEILGSKTRRAVTLIDAIWKSFGDLTDENQAAYFTANAEELAYLKDNVKALYVDAKTMASFEGDEDA